MTLFVSLVSIVIGMGGGIALSFILLSKHDVPRHIGRAYVSFFRGTPLLGQLLLAYYFLPGLIGIDLPPLVAAIGALALNTMAFQAEIYRGGTPGDCARSVRGSPHPRHLGLAGTPAHLDPSDDAARPTVPHQ